MRKYRYHRNRLHKVNFIKPVLKFTILRGKFFQSADEILNAIMIFEDYLRVGSNEQEREADWIKHQDEWNHSIDQNLKKLRAMELAELNVMFHYYEFVSNDLMKRIYSYASEVFDFILFRDNIPISMVETLAGIMFDFKLSYYSLLALPRIVSEKLAKTSSKTDRDRYIAGVLSTVYERLSEVDKLKVKVVLYLKEHHRRESIHASNLQDLRLELRAEGREYLWSIRKEGIPSESQIKEVFDKPKKARTASPIDIEHHINTENTGDFDENILNNS